MVKSAYIKVISCFILVSLIMTIFPSTILAIEKVSVEDNNKLIEFSDSYIKEKLEQYNIAGGTLIIIKDGETIFKKGYGYGDANKNIMVDPDSTVFRIGSITKTFVAVGIMQLVEKEKIDLHSDIHNYLKDIKIKNKFNTLITVEHLLTHTAGFDEAAVGMNSSTINNTMSLKDYFKKYTPEVIRKPGEIFQYSNHGYGILGLIIENVSGVSFEEYIKENIFKPLNMKNTTVKLKEDIIENMSKPYLNIDGEFIEQEHYGSFNYPCGSINSTAQDMGKFMNMLLSGGKYKGTKILTRGSIDKIQTSYNTINDYFNGYGYGLYEFEYSGVKGFGHGGVFPPFISTMGLIPDKNIGVFFSTNTVNNYLGENHDLPSKFLEVFCKELSSDNSIKGIDIDSTEFKTDLKEFQGNYYNVRYSRNTLMKFIFLMQPRQIVSVTKDNKTLSIKYGSEETRLMRISDEIFKTPDNDLIGFINSDNKTYKVNSLGAYTASEKLKGFERPEFYKILFILSIVILLIYILGYVIGLIIRIIKGKKIINKQTRYLNRLLTITSLLNILFLVLLFSYINTYTTFVINQFLLITLSIPLITLLLTIIAIVFNIKVIKDKEIPKLTKIINIIVLIGLLGFMVALKYSNLIGYNFR